MRGRALVLAALCACASARLLPLSSAAAGAWQPLPVQYEKTRFLFFKSLENDGSLQRFYASGPVVLATVLRPETGLFASQDQGGAWSYAPLRELPRQLLFDPADPRKITARLGMQILHSSDGGHAFSVSVPGSENLDALAVGGGGAVLAAAPGRLFVSEDGAQTWRALSLQIQTRTPWRARSIAVDPAHPGTIFVSIHVEEEQPPDMLARFTALLDYTSDEAVSALALADARDEQPRPIAWNAASGDGVYVTQDGGALWKKTGLALDAFVTLHGGALYAVAADPILQAATLVRRYPDLAALADRQMRGDKADPPGLRAACRYPGRDKLLAGPLAAALVLRSDDGGANWARVSDPPLPVALALREAVERALWEPAGFRSPPQPQPQQQQQPQRQQGQRGGGRGSRYMGAQNPQRSGVPRGFQKKGVAGETLLAFVDPMRLLAHFNGGLPLSGAAAGAAYVSTEARWNALADSMAAESESEGELSLGPGAPPQEQGAAFELLRSDDGATWQPLPFDAPAKAFPESIAATPQQIFLLLSSRDKSGTQRAAFRVSR